MAMDRFANLRQYLINLLFVLVFASGMALTSKRAEAFVLLPKECREKQTECIKNQSLDWILIFGEIGYEEDYFFTRLDKLWPKDKPIPVVYVESEGGNARVGIKVGRILHKRNGVIATGNPITQDDGRQCSSACALIALGATERHLRHVGFHQPYHIKNYCQPDQTVVDVEPETLQRHFDYFKEMGAPEELIEVYKNTPHEQFSEYFYASMIEPEHQDIVRWAFYSTPGPGSRVKLFPSGLGPRSLTLVNEMQFAIDAGSREAVQSLADIYICQSHGERPNYKKAAATLRAAFDKNDNDAGYRLVSMIQSGRVEGQSKLDAVALLSKLSDRNYADAKADLAMFYYEGNIMPKNYLKAVDLAKEAAKQKSPLAYSALCKFYSDPKIMKRDDIEAYKWCDLAIASLESGKDKDFATRRINALADRMSDRQIDNAMKREEAMKSEKEDDSEEE